MYKKKQTLRSAGARSAALGWFCTHRAAASSSRVAAAAE